MRAAPELKPRALQPALESPNAPAQAVSNIYHPQVGLGRRGARSLDSKQKKALSREGNKQRFDLLTDTFLPLLNSHLPSPCLFGKQLLSFLPEEPSSSIRLSLQKLQLPH